MGRLSPGTAQEPLSVFPQTQGGQNSLIHVSRALPERFQHGAWGGSWCGAHRLLSGKAAGRVRGFRPTAGGLFPWRLPICRLASTACGDSFTLPHCWKLYQNCHVRSTQTCGEFYRSLFEPKLMTSARKQHLTCSREEQCCCFLYVPGMKGLREVARTGSQSRADAVPSGEGLGLIPNVLT